MDTNDLLFAIVPQCKTKGYYMIIPLGILVYKGAWPVWRADLISNNTITPLTA